VNSSAVSAARDTLAAIAKTYAAALGILVAGGMVAAIVGYAALSHFGFFTAILVYLLAAGAMVGLGTGIALIRTARFTDPDSPWSTASAALACLGLTVAAATHLSRLDFAALIPLSIGTVGGLFIDLGRAARTR
jgi:hypothetical protein